jgi:hypothetical protein
MVLMKNILPHAVQAMSFGTGRIYVFRSGEEKWCDDGMEGRYGGILRTIKSDKMDNVNVIPEIFSEPIFVIAPEQMKKVEESVPENIKEDVPEDVIVEFQEKVIEKIPEDITEVSPEELTIDDVTIYPLEDVLKAEQIISETVKEKVIEKIPEQNLNTTEKNWYKKQPDKKRKYNKVKKINVQEALKKLKEENNGTNN